MKNETGGGGGVLDVVRFSPRDGKPVTALSCRARFSKKQCKSGVGESLEYNIFLP